MRHFKLIVLSLVPLMTTGCMLDMLMSTAIQSELQAEQLGTLQRQLENAQQTTSDIEINHAIQAYAAEHGEYPASLQALVPEYFTQVPTQPDGRPYGYDPSTGKVLLDGPVAPQPARSQESNTDKMARIRGAINQYGMATGYYPTSLDQLAPTYLKEVPKANNGMPFIYDPQTGALYEPQGQSPNQVAPYGGQTAQTGTRQPGVGGGGLMGETMTGIGIQNELNSMSSAGSSAAGSRARGGARDIGSQQTQRQEQAMDDLGL
ncbi:MAG: hypothetical protein AMXMBFR82_04350 [Candidatus Hydrogenedentota bacterium]